MKLSSRIGKTKYELEETGTPQVLKITRRGSGDEQTFFIPRDLVVDFVCQKVTPRTADFVIKDLSHGMERPPSKS